MPQFTLKCMWGKKEKMKMKLNKLSLLLIIHVERPIQRLKLLNSAEKNLCLVSETIN